MQDTFSAFLSDEGRTIPIRNFTTRNFLVENKNYAKLPDLYLFTWFRARKPVSVFWYNHPSTLQE